MRMGRCKSRGKKGGGALAEDFKKRQSFYFREVLGAFGDARFEVWVGEAAESGRGEEIARAQIYEMTTMK